MAKFQCPICKLPWRKNQASIQCSTCLNWIHHHNKRHCSLMTDEEFNLYTETEDLSWNCSKCDALALPFYDLDDNHLLLNAFLCLVSNDITLVPNNDINHFVAECEAISSSSLNLEDEEYFPSQVNSKYYDILQLNSRINLPVLD